MAKRKGPQMELEDGLTVTQLATRVPKALYKVVKVFCVTSDVSIADFVSEALQHELDARQAEVAGKAKAKAAKPRRRRSLDEDDDDYQGEDDEDAA
jgi:hypothetical protein